MADKITIYIPVVFVLTKKYILGTYCDQDIATDAIILAIENFKTMGYSESLIASKIIPFTLDVFKLEEVK